MLTLASLVVLIAAYLIGSIPVGVLVGKIFGFDPRTVGSHNIGVTNVARAGGRTAAILTLVGYSMNDTIVVFDRIRENLKTMRRESLTNVINLSVNQTLSRTVLTSGLTLLTALALWLFGGPVLNGFAFALVVGIVVGTYSSIFVASPILVFWQDYSESRKKAVAVSGASAREAVRRGAVKPVK